MNLSDELDGVAEACRLDMRVRYYVATEPLKATVVSSYTHSTKSDTKQLGKLRRMKAWREYKKNTPISSGSRFDKTVGITYSLLRKLIQDDGHSIHQVAKMLGCGDITIREGMRIYSIKKICCLSDEQKCETLCECVRRRRLKISQLSEDFTRDEWLEKVESTDGICSFCGRSYKEGGGLTLDHIFPVSRAPPGFCYTIDDVQPMCRSCNSSKRDTIVLST